MYSVHVSAGSMTGRSPLIAFVEGQDFRVRQGPPKQLNARGFLFVQALA
jgi:hypothetical protein